MSPPTIAAALALTTAGVLAAAPILANGNSSPERPEAFHERCTSCHDRGQAGRKQPGASGHLACVRCHAKKSGSELAGGWSAAAHPAVGGREPLTGGHAQDAGCLTCHDPHRSGSRHLLRDTEPPVSHGAEGHRLDPASRLCLGCHRDQAEWGHAEAYRRHPVGITVPASRIHRRQGIHLPLARSQRRGEHASRLISCRTCHDVHASRQANLLRWAEEEIVDACTTCHPKDTDRRSDELQARAELNPKR